MGSTPQLRRYGHQRNVVNHRAALAPFLSLSASPSRLLSRSLFVPRDGPFSPSLRRSNSLYRVLLRSTVTLSRSLPVPRSPRARANLHPPRAEASSASASARSVSRQDRGAWRLRAPLPVVPDVTTPPLVQHSGYVTLLTAIIKVFTRVPAGRSPLLALPVSWPSSRSTERFASFTSRFFLVVVYAFRSPRLCLFSYCPWPRNCVKYPRKSHSRIVVI